MKELKDILSAKYIEFLNNKKFEIGSKSVFNRKGIYFLVKEFYSISDADVLIRLNDEYKGRFKAGFFIIADADNGDYVLMDQAGSVFFWNHEVNDLGYNDQSPLPKLISKDVAKFFSMLEEDSGFDIDPEVRSIKLSDDFNDLFKDYLK